MGRTTTDQEEQGAGASRPAGTRFLDTSTAADARIYDWFLGGVDNYEPDRVACRDLLAVAPGAQQAARANRAFLIRAVRHLAGECGVVQFIDFGCGLPTDVNVHDVAQGTRPGARVVYVDHDPVVLAHARTSLDDNEHTMVVDCDVREPGPVRQATDGFLDWAQPIAALFCAVLDCLPDTGDGRNPKGVLRSVVSDLSPGSHVVVSHRVSDDPAVRRGITAVMHEAVGRWGAVREAQDVRSLFDGLEAEFPGIGDVADWQPGRIPPPPQELRPAGGGYWSGIGLVPAPPGAEK
ncbi:SAM-dependent methyltransferase [Streptomyces sp. Edi2]|uniref:SAM-dependent methyltransferase n=1 Tax=Streptomyces sp. Edi2 TaxID=3162528 RepID=UPI00330601EE